MEIKRLNTENYDELLELLNYTFGNKYGREMDFVREQPKMWVREDEYVNKHIGVFEDNKLISVIGIYPLHVNILGKKFLFATTGNLATHPDYKGRGYFTKLFALTIEELDKLNVDLLCAYQIFVGEQVDVPIAHYMQKELEIMGRCGNEISIASHSKFKIINFCGITDAFVKLKCKYSDLPQGEFIMDIEGYGKIRIYSNDVESGCEMTEKDADISVNKDATTRIIFGFPFEFQNSLPDYAKIWFPLPLS